MKRGQVFIPDGPLTLGDLRRIVADSDGKPDDRLIDLQTPMAGDRRQVKVTVLEYADTRQPVINIETSATKQVAEQPNPTTAKDHL
ncbi:hypothetical protein [Mycobacteroides abscessus]|uniref:hypothetical protein n=1 Tax=Mycobacteroides abscessus TaxID=36809 RepID=UPI0002587F3E|nr:hypothetical protein [Mycobacteroides abscessus]QSM01913.1 hypothetical protein PROPHIGD11-3_17 [Mycobacterium phage prophiGD11-3]QSM03395.1 hypothetical protein PROPHIGD62-2_18 [Mycobacterium phage prophi62-2]QSM04540.1 hypothetical protein PROPHIGD08-3_17 [Mycobacterium phage prophiGD08-3]EIC70402.1 hypothetical protein S7W_05788 [Mycobacteroides abscessus M94]MBE5409512.1 hypothetical protein [Mycobacteroides abscessus]